MKTYTVEEAKAITGQFILEQAEILRQELRQAKRTNQLFLGHA